MRAINFVSSLLISDRARVSNEETELGAHNPQSAIRIRFVP